MNIWSKLKETSTEVLRRSPQWALNTHTHTNTHTEAERKREVNQQSLVKQWRSSNYNKFEFNYLLRAVL